MIGLSRNMLLQPIQGNINCFCLFFFVYSHSSVAEDILLPRCDAVSLEKYSPTFRTVLGTTT
jgi:hypothetical protein